MSTRIEVERTVERPAVRPYRDELTATVAVTYEPGHSTEALNALQRAYEAARADIIAIARGEVVCE